MLYLFSLDYKEAGRFKDMVDKLQEVISKRCDYEGKKSYPLTSKTDKQLMSIVQYSFSDIISDQNEELRKQIAGMKDKSSKIEEVIDVFLHN